MAKNTMPSLANTKNQIGLGGSMKIKRIREHKFEPIEIKFENQDEWAYFRTIMHVAQHNETLTMPTRLFAGKICCETASSQWTELEI